jgi:hypothetical protein
MSEKLLPCPFCGGEASAEQCVRVDYYGDWVVGCDNEQCCAKPEVLAAIKSAAIAAWNRRTPAPEGEAWRTVPVEPTEAMIEAAHALWGEGTGVNYVQLEPEDFYAAMLAASPVVPVGVSDQQRAKIELVLVGYRNRITTLDAATDAILATLRFTDTGRE